jgi:hypothetical protein
MSKNNIQQSITKEMVLLCKELQAIPKFESFYLGGGTGLALYFNHRQSDDLDLISSSAFSKEELFELKKELEDHFSNRLVGKIEINDLDDNGKPVTDNLLFLRFMTRTNETSEPIKVEMIQNVYQNNRQPIIKSEIKVLPVELIGVLKMAAANERAANKDIYDMHFLTKDGGNTLMKICKNYDTYKQYILTHPDKVSLFDQRINSTPICEDPSLLLTFENKRSFRRESVKMPMHSNHEINPLNGNCSIQVAKSQYRMKINSLYNQLGIKKPMQRGMTM